MHTGYVTGERSDKHLRSVPNFVGYPLNTLDPYSCASVECSYTMDTYPLITGLICFAFAAIVLVQWTRRAHAYQLIWGISLLFGSAAAFMFVAFLHTGSPFYFRLYYIFGALLVAAYLGMGSLFLVIPAGVARAILAISVVLSACGASLLLVTPIDGAALSQVLHSGNPGAGVFVKGIWLAFLIPHNVFGAVSVLAVALYTTLRSVRRQAPYKFAIANAIIAVGVITVSQAGSSARLGLQHGFWTITALGMTVLFVGFLVTMLPSTLRSPLVPDAPKAVRS